jgi:hypothetical protein
MKKISKSLASFALLAIVGLAQATTLQSEPGAQAASLTHLECAVWTGEGNGYEGDGIPPTVTIKVERLLDSHLKNGISLDGALELIVSGCKAERILNQA